MDRRFWIANGRWVDFEAAFGLGGTWSKLLDQADGYSETEFCCESPQLSQDRVRDFWNWHRNFEIFRARFQAEIEAFADWLRRDRVVEKEQFLGAYYERFEDGGEQVLVLR